MCETKKDDKNGRSDREKKVDDQPASNRFAKLRGVATVKMSTEEIMILTRGVDRS